MKTTFFRHLLSDESGFIVSTELILVATILVLGIIVGSTTLRDQVVTELADSADAISALDHGFEYSSIDLTVASVAGTAFNDQADFCDDNDNGSQGGFTSGTCVLIDGGLDFLQGPQIIGETSDSF